MSAHAKESRRPDPARLPVVGFGNCRVRAFCGLKWSPDLAALAGSS